MLPVQVNVESNSADIPAVKHVATHQGLTELSQFTSTLLPGWELLQAFTFQINPWHVHSVHPQVKCSCYVGCCAGLTYNKKISVCVFLFCFSNTIFQFEIIWFLIDFLMHKLLFLTYLSDISQSFPRFVGPYFSCQEFGLLTYLVLIRLLFPFPGCDGTFPYFVWGSKTMFSDMTQTTFPFDPDQFIYFIWPNRGTRGGLPPVMRIPIKLGKVCGSSRFYWEGGIQWG